MIDRILSLFNLNSNYHPAPIAQLASQEDCEKFIDQSINDARFERLIAVGYGTLAVVTAIALIALAFAGCFVGFGLVAASFYICALLKPFFPRNIGFFISDIGPNLASFPAQRGHEVLAPWFIPIAVVVGYLATLGTTLLIRFLVRHFSRLRQKI